MPRWTRWVWVPLCCGLISAIGCYYQDRTIDGVAQSPDQEPTARAPSKVASRPAEPVQGSDKPVEDPSASRAARMTREYSERVNKGRNGSVSDQVTADRFGNTRAQTRPSALKPEDSKTADSTVPQASKRAVHMDTDSADIGSVRANVPTQVDVDSGEKPESVPPSVTAPKASEEPKSVPPKREASLPKPETPKPSAPVTPPPTPQPVVPPPTAPKKEEPRIVASRQAPAELRPLLQPPQEPRPQAPAKPAAPSMAQTAPSEEKRSGFVVPKPPDVPTTPAKSRHVDPGKKSAKGSAPPVLEVKAAEPPKVPSTEPTRAAQPNQPIRSIAAPAEGDIKSVIEQRLKDVQSTPNDLEKQLQLRLLYVVDNQPEKALAEIPGTNAPTQAIIQRIMKMVLTASKSKGRDSAAAATQLLDSVEDLRKLLRTHADLQVATLKLCSKVESFGVFEEIKTASFQVGHRNRVIVYCEIRNFRIEPTEDSQNRVLLAQKIKVLNSEGKTVYDVGDEDVPYISRRPIEDFFLVQLVELPTSLSPGKYILRVYVEDKLAGKATEGQTEFTMRSTTTARKP